MKNLFLKITNNVILAISLLILSVVVVVNLIYSYDVSENIFVRNNLLLIIVSIAILFVVILLLKKLVDRLKIETHTIHKVLIAYAIIVCTSISIMFLAPLSSSYDAMVASQGQYVLSAEYGTAAYIECYPHQRSLALLYNLLFSLFGQGSFIMFYAINTFAIVTILYYLPLIIRRLSHNEEAVRVSMLLLFFFLPLLALVVWLYNDLIAIALAVAAVNYQLLFLESTKKRHLIASSLLIGLAIIVRSNLVFFLIGMLFLYAYKIVKKQQGISCVLVVALCLLATQGLMNGISGAVFKTQDAPSHPTIYWVAMSLQDQESIGGRYFVQPGYFNHYHNHLFYDVFSPNNPTVTYEEFNDQKDMLADLYFDDVKSRLSYFLNNPDSAVVFFGKRLAITWCESSLGAEDILRRNFNSQTEYLDGNLSSYIWFTGTLEPKHTELGDTPINYQSRFAYSIAFGKLGIFIQNFITEPLHIGILLSALLFIISYRKKISPEHLMFFVIFLGGFVFYEFIWETRSRYVLTLFIALLPIAALALADFFAFLDNKIKEHKPIASLLRRNPQKDN